MSSAATPKIHLLHCMGDSITNSDTSLGIHKSFAYPYLVQKAIGGICRARNFGIPGNTTTQMLARFSDMIKHVPTVATIYGGINDNGNSIATATTQSNIQSMITQLQNAGCTKIILCNIHTIPGTSGTQDTVYDPYRTVIQNLATTNSLPLCDFHAVTLVNPTDYQTDIVHLTPGGLQKLADKLKATLDTKGWTSLLVN